MLEGVLLRDHAAHRDAHQVEPLDPERVDEGLRVVGEQLGGVRAGGLVGRADAPVVEGEHAVARLEQGGRLVRPGLLLVGEPVDQDDRLRAVALERVGDVDAVGGDGGHAGSGFSVRSGVAASGVGRVRSCSERSRPSVRPKWARAIRAASSGRRCSTASASARCCSIAVARDLLGVGLAAEAEGHVLPQPEGQLGELRVVRGARRSPGAAPCRRRATRRGPRPARRRRRRGGCAPRRRRPRARRRRGRSPAPRSRGSRRSPAACPSCRRGRAAPSSPTRRPTAAPRTCRRCVRGAPARSRARRGARWPAARCSGSPRGCRRARPGSAAAARRRTDRARTRSRTGRRCGPRRTPRSAGGGRRRRGRRWCSRGVEPGEQQPRDRLGSGDTLSSSTASSTPWMFRTRGP